MEAYLFTSRYGLGTCYLRMSKVRIAEYHFRRAAEIHPRNAVLLGCVGMVGCFVLSASHEDNVFLVGCGKARGSGSGPCTL